MRYRLGHDPFGVGSVGRRWQVRRLALPDDLPTAGPVGSGYVSRQLPPTRINAWVGLVAVVMLLFASRAAYLQLARGSHYRQLADGNRIRILPVPAQRGLLYDRFGQPLVAHQPNLQLLVVPYDLPREFAARSQLEGELATLLHQPLEQLHAQWEALDRQSYQPVVIAENLGHQQAIRATMISSRLPAVRLDVGVLRQYPIDGALSLSHVLGYLGKIGPEETASARERGYARSDWLGKAGLEQALEEVLRGRQGREQVEVDATGRRKEVIAFEEPIAGADVILTIDFQAQRRLEAALQRSLAVRPTGQGVAIALDPRNGEILALVSLPSFDNNWFARGITTEEFTGLTQNPELPLFNRAVQGTYPPGSTVKPLIAAAGLQEGVITVGTTIASTGGLRVNQWFFPDWKAGGHGPTTVTLAIAESVNTYFYYVAGGYDAFAGLGVERLTGYLRRAGLGRPLGIELLGEAAGLVPDPAWKEQFIKQPWYIGDTYHLAIGQGDLLVTPLHVAAFTAMIANGGTLQRPHLVREMKPPGARFGTRVQPDALTHGLFAPEHLAVVRRGLRQAVRTGSARALNAVPLNMAGKTGTAQWSSTRPNHAWFTGYAPADDPQIVVTVLIQEGGDGSTAAVPVAAEFLTWWANERR